jgi:hypothetical protein
MPLPTLTAPEQAAALAAADSDLKFLLSDTDVDNELQAVLFHFGFRKLRLFANLEVDSAKVQGVIKDQLGLDPADDLATRSRVAHVLAAWEAAQQQVNRDNEIRAENRASRLPRTSTQLEASAMRKAVEAQFGKIPNEEVPSRSYLGTKLDEVEENDPKAESLKEVASKEDIEQDVLTADLTNSGIISVRKGIKDLKMPANSEELRSKLRLLSNAWLMAKAKHLNRPWLAGLTPADFGKYTDYLLGKRVWQMQGRDSAGNVVATPTWELVLSYEFELRKKAYDLVKEDAHSLSDALGMVIKDVEIRERYLITPMTFMASFPGKRLNPWPDQNDSVLKKGKDAGKGGGGGGKQQQQQKLHTRTPDGRNICFKFNNPEEGCNGSCGFAHVCQVCLGNHTKFNCGGGGKGGGGKGGGKGGRNRGNRRGRGGGGGGRGGGGGKPTAAAPAEAVAVAG